MSTEMSTEEFVRAHAAIESAHDRATIMHDRDLAQLFVKSGWTQERIAEQIGKDQSWVNRHLRFGRFLNFMPVGIKLGGELTERQFRGHWDATSQDRSDQERFQDVCRALGVAPPAAVPDDLDVAIKAFNHKLGYPLSASSKTYVKTLFTKGTENIRAMIGKEKDNIGLERAYEFVRIHSQNEQNNATLADVKAYKYRDYNVKKKSKKPAVKTKPKATPIPRQNLTKLDVGNERIHGQPVQLFPVSVQRLQEAQIRVGGLASIVMRIGSDAVFATDQFWNDVELLLAYQPVTGKKNGEETDFAKRARVSLAQFEQYVTLAAERICALRDSLAEKRKVA